MKQGENTVQTGGNSMGKDPQIRKVWCVWKSERRPEWLDYDK